MHSTITFHFFPILTYENTKKNTHRYGYGYVIVGKVGEEKNSMSAQSHHHTPIPMRIDFFSVVDFFLPAHICVSCVCVVWIGFFFHIQIG